MAKRGVNRYSYSSGGSKSKLLPVLFIGLVLAVVFLAYSLFTGPSIGLSPGVNYVSNPTFNGSSLWSFGYEKGNGTVGVVNNQLKITGYGFGYQKVATLVNASGKTFTLSFRAMKNGSNAAVYIQELPSWQAKVVLKPTINSGWNTYSTTFILPSNNQYIVSLATDTSDRKKSTSVYYDDVSLTESSPMTSCYWSPDPTDSTRVIRGQSNQLMNMTSYTEERLLCYSGRWYAAKDDWSYLDYKNDRTGYTDISKKYWGITVPTTNTIVGSWKIVNDSYWGMKWVKNIVASNVTCTDSDGGLNYYVRGVVSGYDRPTGNYVSNISDYCVNNYNLKEYTCDGIYGMENEYNCPIGYSCTNGACITNQTGSNVTIVGSNNTYVGNNLTIIGFNNTVIGNNSVIRGNYTITRGNNITITGRNNTVIGNNVSVYGNNNTIYRNNTVIRSNNTILK